MLVSPAVWVTTTHISKGETHMCFGGSREPKPRPKKQFTSAEVGPKKGNRFRGRSRGKKIVRLQSKPQAADATMS